MKPRALTLLLLKASVLAPLAAAPLAGCGHNPGGKLAVDLPILPYQAPDVEELSGSEDADAAEQDAAEAEAK